MNNTILNLAHRGASAHTDENTLEAFKLAFKMGADGCEIDVHVCKSGELIVMHDEQLSRTTDGEGLIAEMTLDQIKQLRTAAGYEVPTLREVLAVIPRNKILNIELKGIGTGSAFFGRWEQHYQSLIAAEWLLFSSFRESELTHIPSTFKVASFVDDPAADLNQVIIKDRYSVHLRGDVADNQSIPFFQKKGLQVYVWTINDTDEMKRLIELGVDGIFTDEPQMLRTVLREN